MVSLARLARLLLTRVWFRLLLELLDLEIGFEEVMGLGRSSSGLKEDIEDPVEDPRTCLDNPVRGLRLSVSFILSILRLKVETLDRLEACKREALTDNIDQNGLKLTLICVFMTRWFVLYGFESES